MAAYSTFWKLPIIYVLLVLKGLVKRRTAPEGIGLAVRNQLAPNLLTDDLEFGLNILNPLGCFDLSV